LVGKPEGKRPLGRPRRRWEDNIKMHLKEAVTKHDCTCYFHGCETWFLTLREETRLRVFENRVLKGTFGPKREEVARSWRRLHNEEPHDAYASTNIISVIKSKRMR
jgi:hypothetical protein